MREPGAPTAHPHEEAGPRRSRTTHVPHEYFPRLPDAPILIVPEWIRAVSWLDRTVNVVVTRQQIKHAPAYDAALLLERLDEEALFQHYRSTGYSGQPFRRSG